MTLIFFLLSATAFVNAQELRLISEKPITQDIPETIEGTRAGNLLWGRHNQKYVRVGRFRYTVLQEFPVHPRDASIYKFDEQNPDVGWRLAWRNNHRDAHQAASLYLDATNRLHLIYPLDNIGKVVHKIFTGVSNGNITLLKNIDTSIWGRQNFYFGTVYDNQTNRLYLCSNNWIEDRFRCATFRDDIWYFPHVLLQYPGHRYLYPNMYAWGHQFWVSVSAHKNGKMPSGSRERSLVRKMSHYGGQSEYHMSLGVNDEREHAYFENDMVFDGDDTLYIVGTYTEDSRKVFLYAIDKNTGFKNKKRIPDASGSSFNMAYFQGRIILFGKGQYFMTSDQGDNWTNGRYEAHSFPRSEYRYSYVSTLKRKSGSRLDANKIMLLQEVEKRSDGSGSVVALDFVLGD